MTLPKLRTLSPLFFGLIFMLPLASVAAQSEKYALLVAVENYQHRDLRSLQCTVDDAKDLSKFLLAHGYDKVDLVLDKQATQAEIRSKLEALNRRGTDNGAVLIGMFGHGVELQDNKLSYFCPHDARFTAKVVDADGKQLFEDGVSGKPLIGPDKESLISLNEILAALKTSPAKDRIVIADCCRDDPTAARSLFATSFTLDPNEPVAILLACQRGKRAFERYDSKTQQGNGLLTRSLIAHWNDRLHTGSVKIADGMDQLKQRVAEQADALGVVQEPLGFGSFSVDLQIRPVEAKNGEVIKLAPGGLELIWIRHGEIGMWVGRTEVTQLQYTSVLNQSPWTETDLETAKHIKIGGDYPACCITWESARRFCEALTREERQAGRLGRNETYRLPRSDEWISVARYTMQDATVRNLSQYGWYVENATKQGEAFAHEVATQQPFRFGLADLFGNVFEWCSDDAINNKYRTVVGGSYNSTAEKCVEMKASRLNIEFADATIGFRIVRGVQAN